MIDLGAMIVRELADPRGKDLQARMLEAMLMMERYRGVSVDVAISPNVGDADVSEPVVRRLADALERFIREYPQHDDAGSAVWALGKLRDERYAQLFRSIADLNSDYSDWARDQASCALEDMA